MNGLPKLATEYGIAGALVVALYGSLVVWANALPAIPDAWMIPLLGTYAAIVQAVLRGALIVGRWWGVFPPEGWSAKEPASE